MAISDWRNRKLLVGNPRGSLAFGAGFQLLFLIFLGASWCLVVPSNSTFPDLWFFSDISSVSRAHCPSKLFPIGLEWLIYNPYCRPIPKYILSIHCCLKLQCLEHQPTPGTCGITPPISDRPSLLGGCLSDPTPQYLWLILLRSRLLLHVLFWVLQN